MFETHHTHLNLASVICDKKINKKNLASVINHQLIIQLFKRYGRPLITIIIKLVGSRFCDFPSNIMFFFWVPSRNYNSTLRGPFCENDTSERL